MAAELELTDLQDMAQAKLDVVWRLILRQEEAREVLVSPAQKAMFQEAGSSIDRRQNPLDAGQEATGMQCSSSIGSHTGALASSEHSPRRMKAAEDHKRSHVCNLQ